MSEIGPTFLGEQFRTEVERTFNLSNLQKGRSPISLGSANYTPTDVRRLNHFLVKLKHSDELRLPEWLDPELARFVKESLEHATISGLPVRRRFAYLTVDNKLVEKGKTQRTPGFHLDGLQGEEVLIKTPTCYEICWTNKLPMEISSQGFKVHGMQLSRHNIFDSLANQVYADSISALTVDTLWLMNAYQLHRSVVAPENVPDRLFLRLYISELPITSSKMTITPPSSTRTRHTRPLERFPKGFLCSSL